MFGWAIKCNLCGVHGLVVSALGDSQSSFEIVGSSFIDRTPRWHKELAIQAFGTNDKIALEVGMVGVLIIASGVLGLLSRKRLTPLQFGIVGFGILGALSATERDGAGFIAVIAPLCGIFAGLFAAHRLHSYLTTQRKLSRMPQQSRVPLGWDRRSFIRTVGALGALSGGGVLFASSREQARVQQIEGLTKIPLPRLSDNCSTGWPRCTHRDRNEWRIVTDHPRVSSSSCCSRVVWLCFGDQVVVRDQHHHMGG